MEEFGLDGRVKHTQTFTQEVIFTFRKSRRGVKVNRALNRKLAGLVGGKTNFFGIQGHRAAFIGKRCVQI